MSEKTGAAPHPKHRHIVLRLLGPGLVTGAADDDPSGIATHSQAGAQFGHGLLWTVFLTTPFMIAIQLISAEIGRVSGRGIVAAATPHYPRALVAGLLGLLLVANTINIAADLAAMGEAVALVAGGPAHLYALLLATLSLVLQVLVPYHRYAPILKFMTLALFCYVATALTVQIDWGDALRATVWPQFSASRDFWLMVVAIMGTTISPYLFFWQAAQEVEEMRRAGHPKRPLKELRHGGRGEIRRIEIDTVVGMIFCNVIGYFIVLTTAATLHANGVTHIESAAQAAEALRPLAGGLTFALFALGIVGTGLLAIPVLAASAAYGVAEAFGWPATLEAKASQAVGFYSIIAGATAIGFLLGLSPIGPIRMLVWAAVLNGVVAVPIMAVMMVMASDRRVMGRFRIGGWLAALGWSATALMGLALAALVWSLLG